MMIKYCYMNVFVQSFIQSIVDTYLKEIFL